MFRALITKITGIVAERSHAKRRQFEAPVKIWFEPLRMSGIHISTADGLYLSGETIDMSTSGVAFIVSAIRIKENYLVGHERVLNVEIDLPPGKVRMQVVGRRYERDDVHLSAEKYLVGAEIVEMSPADRKTYQDFLRTGGGRRKAGSPSLEMGRN